MHDLSSYFAAVVDCPTSFSIPYFQLALRSSLLLKLSELEFISTVPSEKNPHILQQPVFSAHWCSGLLKKTSIIVWKKVNRLKSVANVYLISDIHQPTKK